MSPMFDTIKNYYMLGMWSKAKVRNAVRKDKITRSEYKLIVGEDY